MKYPMNVELIAAAHSYWSMWYQGKKVPALVDPDVMAHTCPPGVHDRRLYGKGTDTVVASAEQSFLQLEKDGELQSGWWMALTPCYRDEPILDDTHLPVFLKLELIRIAKDGEELHRFDAEWVAYRFKTWLWEYFSLPTDVVETAEGYDVMYEDLELGSYGIRKTMTGKSYVYGTGLAEPRTSIALERFQHKCETTFD
ncbi:MAG: hypothetical protein ACRC8W_05740 [Plesiomonas shigelloides]